MKTLLITLIGLLSMPLWAAHPVPEIGELAVARLKHNQATIEWVTPKKSYGYIKYGTTKKTRHIQHGKGFDTGHHITLTKLKSSTKYYFRVVSKDKNKKTYSTDPFSFTTKIYEGKDKTIIKILSLPTVSLISPNSATISWKTNKITRGIVTYGTKKKRKPKSVMGDFDTTTHIFTLQNLSPNTRYYFQVISKDKNKKTAKSNYASFRTKKTRANKPIFSNGPALAKLTGDQIKVDFQTDTPCLSHITWGTVPLISLQKKKKVSRIYTRDHIFTLKNLKPNTRYYYIIHLTDKHFRKSKSEIFSAKTSD